MKAIKLSLLLLICQQITLAQSETPPGFLWQVNINGSEFSLAGSVHAGKKNLYPLPEAYLSAYREADYVLFELKEDFGTLEENIFRYAAKDSLEEDQYLDNYLSPDSKEILSVMFKGKEELLARYYRYEGWLLNMAVSGRRSKLIGYDPGLAVDKYFHDMATEDQKMILGLDQLETQLKLFEFEATREQQVGIIESALKRAKQQALSEQPIFESYYSQDTDAFREAFLGNLDMENPQVRAVYDRVFVSRNKTWVRKLIELSVTMPGNYFMLVGCGHYFGPDNVLELLENEGFQVRQLH
jgi:uncharacterized protein YbaP (TraB family)